MTTRIEFPPVVDETYQTRINDWINDGVNDVKASVDEQSSYFRTAMPGGSYVTSMQVDNYLTTAEGKQLLSDMMGAKARALFPLNTRTRIEDHPAHPISEISIPNGQQGQTGRIDQAPWLDSMWGWVAQVRTDAGSSWTVRICNLVTPALLDQEQTTVEVVNADSSLQAEVERLRSANRELETQLRRSDEAHQADIDIIGEVLIEEARRRDWCSEYDGVIERLNRRLNKSLPIREREYEVTVSGFVSVPFSYTVTVSGSDSDDLDQLAREQFENEVVSNRDLINYHADQYAAEVEIEDTEVQ